jgi:hypothetical protein
MVGIFPPAKDGQPKNLLTFPALSIKMYYLMPSAKSDPMDFHGTAFPAAIPWIFFTLPKNESFFNFLAYINSKFPA